MSNLCRSLTTISSRLFVVKSSTIPGRCYGGRIKIPRESPWRKIKAKDLPKETKVSKEMIAHLERLALVDFNNEAGIERLNAAIRFADQLHLVDTEGVEPMDTVLEESALYLREDKVTEGNCRRDIMKNAAKTEDDYFVAPPGNIPLVKSKRSDEDKS